MNQADVATATAGTRGPIDVRHTRIVRTSLTKQASDHLPLVIDFHVG